MVCPLTRDYDHFRDKIQSLDDQDVEADIRPLNTVNTSGTRIGEALRCAVKAHEAGREGLQDVLLLSDGDDPAGDDEWQAGVRAAHDRGIRVITVGIGDPERDSAIQLPDGNRLRYQGEVVQTRLHEPVLQEIARRTGGLYVPARTLALPLGKILNETITDDQLGVFNPKLRVRGQHYQFFFLLAALLLGASVVWARTHKMPKPASNATHGRQRLQPSRSFASFLLMALVSSWSISSVDPCPEIAEGNTAFANATYELALAKYRLAEERATDPGLVAFNEGATLYRLRRYREAAAHFFYSRENAPPARLAESLYNNGNALAQEAGTTSLELMTAAIAAYQECLRQPTRDVKLAANARYNLQIVEARRLKAKSTHEHGTDNEKDQASHTPHNGATSEARTKRFEDADAGETEQRRADGTAEGLEKKTENRTLAGAGHLPLIREQGADSKLSREETLAYLAKIVERVQSEKHEHVSHQNASSPRAGKDW
jgi:tetratricopeptide (TPR) repeat protein